MPKVSEEAMMMEALEAGADNFEAEDEYFEISTTPDNFSKVRDYFDNKKIQYLEAEIKMVPKNYMSLDEETAKKLELIIEKLEELDDVQNVWHNWDEE
jgi:transcriptional/translational regulatory protein YebC/TACO1